MNPAIADEARRIMVFFIMMIFIPKKKTSTLQASSSRISDMFSYRNTYNMFRQTSVHASVPQVYTAHCLVTVYGVDRSVFIDKTQSFLRFGCRSFRGQTGLLVRGMYLMCLFREVSMERTWKFHRIIMDATHESFVTRGMARFPTASVI